MIEVHVSTHILPLPTSNPMRLLPTACNILRKTVICSAGSIHRITYNLSFYPPRVQLPQHALACIVDCHCQGVQSHTTPKMPSDRRRARHRSDCSMVTLWIRECGGTCGGVLSRAGRACLAVCLGSGRTGCNSRGRRCEGRSEASRALVKSGMPQRLGGVAAKPCHAAQLTLALPCLPYALWRLRLAFVENCLCLRQYSGVGFRRTKR